MARRWSLLLGARFDALQIKPEGRNGALPNQDLVNVPMTIANHLSDGLRASLDPDRSLSARVNRGRPGWKRALDVVPYVVAQAVELTGLVERRGTKARRGVAENYVDDLERIAGFMGRCARGAPTGAHASFKTYAVDAVTLRGVRQNGDAAGREATDGARTMYSLGVLMEQMIRGSNNLLEMLHHSMFYYVMARDDRFLSIAEYIAPQALMLVALVITSAALAIYGASPAPPALPKAGPDTCRRKSQKIHSVAGLLQFLRARWIKPDRRATPAGKTHFGTELEKSPDPMIVHDWSSAFLLAAGGYGVGTLAGAACLFAHDSGATALETSAAAIGVAYGGAGALFTLALGPGGVLSKAEKRSGGVARGSGSPARASQTTALQLTREPVWVTLKVVTLSGASTALGALAFFNFALALPVTALLVPACLASGRVNPTHRARAVERRRWRVAAAGMVGTLSAPLGLAALGACMAGVAPSHALGALAAHHRAVVGGTFALPVAFGVAWPTAVLCALTTAGALRATRWAGENTGVGAGGEAGLKKER